MVRAFCRKIVAVGFFALVLSSSALAQKTIKLVESPVPQLNGPLQDKDVLGVKLGMSLAEASRIIGASSDKRVQQNLESVTWTKNEPPIQIAISSQPAIVTLDMAETYSENGISASHSIKINTLPVFVGNPVFQIQRKVSYNTVDQNPDLQTVVDAVLAKYGPASDQKSDQAGLYSTLIFAWRFKNGVSSSGSRSVDKAVINGPFHKRPDCMDSAKFNGYDTILKVVIRAIGGHVHEIQSDLFDANLCAAGIQALRSQMNDAIEAAFAEEKARLQRNPPAAPKL